MQSADLAVLASRTRVLFVKQKLTLAIAESCTGGLLSHIITSTPGASEYFLGAAVTYSNYAKTTMIDVSPATLEAFGAISARCAVEMAKGIRHRLSADIAVSTTGNTGPDPMEDKEVGQVFFGISSSKGTRHEEHRFAGDRNAIKEQAVHKALEIILGEAE